MLRHKRKAAVHTVIIRMLDGKDVEHGVQRGETVEGVIFNVAATLGVSDRSVFGLAYPWEEPREDTDQPAATGPHSWVWLSNHKALVKQLADLNESVSSVAGAEACPLPVVHFRFKFYPRPPLATSVRDDRLRHLLRLQVERDFRDGRLDCSFTMRAYMDAYLVQAELGNYDSRLHCSLDYVRVRRLDAKFDGVEMIKWIAAHHSELDGVTAAEAEMKYLNLATRLPMYGVTSFPVASISGQQLTLNIGMDGIFLTNNMNRAEQYFWHQIVSLSYKRRRFKLEIRPSDMEETSKVRSNFTEYKCSSERVAKLVWLTSMDFHLFYRSRPLASTSGHTTPPASATNSPQTLKTARRLLNRTASLRRSLSARKHHYSTGPAPKPEEGRSPSDSQSVENSTGDFGDLPWRRFSEPTSSLPLQPTASTSAGGKLHHSTDSGRVFGCEESGDGATTSSTPGTAHRSLLSPVLPCENCGWSASWARGVSPHSGSIDEAGNGTAACTCEFRIVRLGAAKLGWSMDSDQPWCMPMIGFTNSGRRLYSITEDGREFLLEGWVVREGDRLTCSLDTRRRFASWYLNDAMIESRSDLPAALCGFGVQPTVSPLFTELFEELRRHFFLLIDINIRAYTRLLHLTSVDTIVLISICHVSFLYF